MAENLLLIALSTVAIAVGTLGGLGGAVILVPLLVLAGWLPSEAAPLGLTAVVAGSVAAAPRQLADRTVNHRLGVTTELAASTGAVVGAIVAGSLSETALVYILAGAAISAALLGGRRTGQRNPVDPSLGTDAIGERIGSLDGAYPLEGGVAPYRVQRLPLGLGLVTVSGFIAGTTGASGGFIKTPVTSELMHAPTKVATATTTFTVGITAATALIVYSLQGRLDVEASAAAMVGALTGGIVGARVQSHLAPARVRQFLSVVLVAVAVVLVVTR